MNNDLEITLEELDGEDSVLDTEIHADQMLWKINQLESEIKSIKEKQIESHDFYERKIESVLKQISYRSNLLENYMISQMASGKKTIKTPHGTLRMTSRTNREFGDEKSLIEFSYKNQIPTRVIEKPDKKAIVEYIKNSGDTPEGYMEIKEDKFSLKTNNQQ